MMAWWCRLQSWEEDRKEHTKLLESVFQTVDVDGNGMLDIDEFVEVLLRCSCCTVAVLEPSSPCGWVILGDGNGARGVTQRKCGEDAVHSQHQ